MDKEKKTGIAEKVSVEFESHSHNEQFARVVTAVFMARLNPTMEELEDVKTAVSEAVTNCVIHAYDGCIGKIRMELSTDGNELTVSIRTGAAALKILSRPESPSIHRSPPETAPVWDLPSWRLSWTGWR